MPALPEWIIKWRRRVGYAGGAIAAIVALLAAGVLVLQKADPPVPPQLTISAEKGKVGTSSAEVDMGDSCWLNWTPTSDSSWPAPPATAKQGQCFYRLEVSTDKTNWQPAPSQKKVDHVAGVGSYQSDPVTAALPGGVSLKTMYYYRVVSAYLVEAPNTNPPQVFEKALVASNVVSVAVWASPPQNVSVAPAGPVASGMSYQVSWDAVAGANAYLLRETWLDDGAPKTRIHRVEGATSKEIVAPPLKQDTEYSYQVSAAEVKGGGLWESLTRWSKPHPPDDEILVKCVAPPVVQVSPASAYYPEVFTVAWNEPAWPPGVSKPTPMPPYRYVLKEASPVTEVPDPPSAPGPYQPASGPGPAHQIVAPVVLQDVPVAYLVQAYLGDREMTLPSAPSNAVTIGPSPPPSVSVTGTVYSGQEYTVSWTQRPDAQGYILREYIVDAGQEVLGIEYPVSGATNTSQQIIVPVLPDGKAKTVCYRVVPAKLSAGTPVSNGPESKKSPQVTHGPVPPPTNLHVQETTPVLEGSKFHLFWTPPKANSDPNFPALADYRYRLEKTEGSSSPVELPDLHEKPPYEGTAPAVVSKTTLTYRVKAYLVDEKHPTTVYSDPVDVPVVPPGPTPAISGQVHTGAGQIIGWRSSLVLDSQDQPRIAYALGQSLTAGGGKPLNCAFWDGTGEAWKIERIASAGKQQYTGYLTDEVSLALWDQDDAPRVCFRWEHKYGYDVYYGERTHDAQTGPDWLTTAVEAPYMGTTYNEGLAVVTSTSEGPAGQTKNANPRVAVRSSNDYYLAERKGWNWDSQEILSTSSTSHETLGSALVLDGKSYPHVVMLEKGDPKTPVGGPQAWSGWVWYASRPSAEIASGKTFTYEEVEAFEPVSTSDPYQGLLSDLLHPSIVLDSAGNPIVGYSIHADYVPYKPGELRLARRVSASNWQVATIVPERITWGSRLAADEKGKVVICYFERDLAAEPAEPAKPAFSLNYVICDASNLQPLKLPVTVKSWTTSEVQGSPALQYRNVSDAYTSTPSLGLDSKSKANLWTGRIHISYCDLKTNHLWYYAEQPQP